MSAKAEPTQLGQPSFHNNKNREIHKNEIGYVIYFNAFPTETEERKLSSFRERLLGRHLYWEREREREVLRLNWGSTPFNTLRPCCPCAVWCRVSACFRQSQWLSAGAYLQSWESWQKVDEFAVLPGCCCGWDSRARALFFDLCPGASFPHSEDNELRTVHNVYR